MIIPQRAPVRPRVKRPRGDTAFLLEEEIAELAAARRRGVVVLRGGAGSGKTTALNHLRALFPEEDGMVLVDCDQLSRQETEVVLRGTDALVVTTLPLGDHYAPWQLEIASWGQDEWIEYLLACHPSQCKSVMARLLNCDQFSPDELTAELCRVVLDEMAADETVISPLDAMVCRLLRHLSRQQQWSLSALALTALQTGYAVSWSDAVSLVPELDTLSWRLLSHGAVQEWIAAAELRELARQGPEGCESCLGAAIPFSRRFLAYAGELIAQDDLAIAHLRQCLRGTSIECQPIVATVLHLAGALQAPHFTKTQAGGNRKEPCLHRAWLERVQWQGLNLSGTLLRSADLRSANLQEAILNGADADGADFSGAVLSYAFLRHAWLESSRMVGADLKGIKAAHVILRKVDLTSACVDNADLFDANLRDAILCNASFRSSDFTAASLRGADIQGAVFTAANLTRAALDGLNFALADFRDARFVDASCKGCVLDGIELPRADCEGADFRSATFTAASMLRANLRDADLRGCGLADVDWEGADLRDADLRGAVFSMGGSRSGLVGSPYPGHGSRTGFYTDDWNDLSTHKHPEEIRKANLCGADLRGANIEGVDFYLVDLRGAQYDPEQAEQLRRCGAILREPVA